MKHQLTRITARLLAFSGAAGALNLSAMAAGNPTTGDNNMVGIMLVVAGVALVGMLVFFLTGKKK